MLYHRRSWNPSHELSYSGRNAVYSDDRSKDGLCVGWGYLETILTTLLQNGCLGDFRKAKHYQKAAVLLRPWRIHLSEERPAWEKSLGQKLPGAEPHKNIDVWPREWIQRPPPELATSVFVPPPAPVFVSPPAPVFQASSSSTCGSPPPAPVAASLQHLCFVSPPAPVAPPPAPVFVSPPAPVMDLLQHQVASST
ncbi:hypothetical protein NPIL_255561 [Nephila pilipes]|uniref:Uncharacterized protein n=1 Tax=Nephila pilipes TaxID=299642 RepID=A0A8X6IYM1_NEPPI|nr:hypothetical protein NPIL_255561 [Nephila pilipes]